MAAGDYFLRLSHLTGLGMTDINGNDATPKMTPGTIAIVTDALGPRILKYVKVLNDVVRGDLVSKPGGTNGVLAVDDITAGTTTSATKSGFTAGDHAGVIVSVYDNADDAGTAPEGEFSVISNNSTTVLTMEPDLPFSVALAANDDLALIATYQAEDSADGDFAHAVHGVVVGVDGITDNSYGWVQCEGITKAKLKSEALTMGVGLAADAAVLGAASTDGIELWCGIVLQTTKADMTADTGMVRLQLFSAQGVGGTP